MRKIIPGILSLLVMLTGFYVSSIGQNVGIDAVLIRFQTPPTTYTVRVTPLKYDKDFAFGMQLVGGRKDIYTHAYPVLNSGFVNGTFYPGYYYTDGCGNDIPFKMSSAFYSFENSNEDGHDPNGPYASEMLHGLNFQNFTKMVGGYIIMALQIRLLFNIITK